MKPISLILACALAGATYNATAATKNDALKLNSTVITANREAQSNHETSTANSIFTRADIERLRPANVLELLTHAPGVQVANYGGRGALYGLYMRGTSSAQSLILIDGVRMNSTSAGMAGLQYLSMDQIERVEVLRGARSALYGADAMGGVIQVFTRRGHGFGLQPTFHLATGSDGTHEYSAGLSGANERTQFYLGAALEESQGYDRTRTSYASDADHDAYRNRSLTASLSHQFNDVLEAGFSVLDQRGSTEFDNPFGRWDNNTYNSYPAKPYDHFTISASQMYVEGQFNTWWKSRLELGHSEDRQENFDKLFAGSSVNNTYRDSVTWLNTLALNDAQTLRVGAEYLNDKLRTSNDIEQSGRKNHAVFIQHNTQARFVSTELGMRHDKNEQFGSANTFNAALTVPLNDDHQLIGSYSEGFRVPTFSDLYWPLDYSSWYVGNPNLKPERSHTYELKWRGQWHGSSFEAALYHSQYSDLLGSAIDTQNGLYTTTNISKARINGFELSAQRSIYGWQSALALSLLDPRDQATGRTLPNRARRTVTLDFDRTIGQFAVGSTLKAIGPSFANADNTRQLPGYAVLDLRASWRATEELTLDAKWSNALDKDYSRLEYSHAADGVNFSNYGYQEAPSAIMLGLTWSPNL